MRQHDTPGSPIQRFGGPCRRFGIELPEELAIQVARRARAETRSFNAVVRDAVTAYVAQHGEGATT